MSTKVMWFKKALAISMVVSFTTTLIVSASMSEIIEFKNPEYQATSEFKELSNDEQDKWYEENSISHKGLSYIFFVLTDWGQFKLLLSSLWVLFIMCFVSCMLMKRVSGKNGS